MNTERILNVVQHLRAAPTSMGLGFQMADYVSDVSHIRHPTARERHPDQSGHSCGTVACIAGHTRVYQLVEQGWEPKDAIAQAAVEGVNCHDHAATYFGLNSQEADELFVQMYSKRSRLWSVNIEQAATVLENIAKRGYVAPNEWDIALGHDDEPRTWWV